MEKIKVYKHETVTSVTEIQAETPEQAIKYARAAEGMPQAPEYAETNRRNPRISLSPDVTRESKKSAE